MLQPLSPQQRGPRAHSTAELVHRVTDSSGAIVADFNYFAAERVLYVCWHGHLTGELVIRVAEASLPWIEQLHPLGLVNDKRGSTGEWGDSVDWIQFEWLPRAKQNGMFAFAYVIDPATTMSFENAGVANAIGEEIELRMFYSLPTAWRWLRQRTQRMEKTSAA
ncbi:hypothetical protein [Solirubrum puertoriconensis]|uniref:Uncharacterized protein n=1 Tax=Solirubrum puertoriconensis TaxID=1751427 RepID=A0A9X0HP52_SOLP1|nr:hypothetical protein [Solirubrum puertoriconensis]KUG09657.1 hypothetical protein ASU33_18375 [Solirubrum puertoriconensis]